MNLPGELRSPRKGLINIKNKDIKCFHGVMLDILILWKNIQKELKTKDSKIVEKIDDDRTEFSVQEEDFSKIEVKNNICINVFDNENGLVFPIYVSDQKFEDSIDLLLLINGNKSYYV